MDDTIVAIATPVGESSIGVIRLSGKNTFKIIEEIFQSKKFKNQKQKTFPMVCIGKIIDKNNVIDEAVVTFFKAPHSYTGEDVVEISCHGNPYLLKNVLDIITSKGARLAKPGEFTQRAYLNGRIDLLKAEAINDLIRAHTRYAHLAAISQMEGKLSEKINELYSKLLDILASVEASIDHSDIEETFLPSKTLFDWLVDLRSKVEKLLSTAKTGKITVSGLKVALVGAPNTGKSSIMNALLREDRVIVSDIPGTTRDVICDELSIRGISVRLFDTAGVRESSDILEKKGIEMTDRVIKEANLIAFVLDGSRKVDKSDMEIFEKIKERDFFIVLNKIDLPVQTTPEDVLKIFGKNPLCISAIKCENISRIEDEIEKYYFSTGYSPETDILITNARQENLLREVIESISKAIESLKRGLSEEFIASDLRKAKVAFEEMTGKVADDAILDRIFSRFCIGK